MKKFNLTPDPNVLVALARNPMTPIDAISELIDNAIDSIHQAELGGDPEPHPLILIKIPSPAEIDRGEGVIQVRDNGAGMNSDQTEKAMRAGFSSKNPHDTLGLFGMGLNIATAKLGIHTTLTTTRRADNHAIKAALNLDELQKTKSYEVQPEQLDKPSDFERGSIIEVSNWWRKGNSNHGFVKKLAGFGKPRIREAIGRRYATLLKNEKVRILVNGEPCMPFEHCKWGPDRFVRHRNIGKVYAHVAFDKVINSQERCSECNEPIPPNENSCICGSSSFRTIEERIKGWVGIKRFDDSNEFGIDLIRNGRAIRSYEQSAFFEFTDEFGNTIKDYPVDSQYGRIIGEVHLNHVPVDFMKQDFQRWEPEWQRAMEFLRGSSSLQPKQPGASENQSPIFKLYQGFRKVRKIGTGDMYMGYWESEKGKPARIDRETEQEYYKKFLAKFPGYYDDSEWWKLVEAADSKPLEKLVNCPECDAQNPKGVEACTVCEAVINGKKCIEEDCETEMVQSAISCPNCGKVQIPEVLEPWKCNICNAVNQSEAQECNSCSAVRGTENLLSVEHLRENSDRLEGLSRSGCSVKLSDGSSSQPIDLKCYSVRHTLEIRGGCTHIPAIIQKGEVIEVFFDKQHKLFKSFGINLAQIAASELANYILVQHNKLAGNPEHTLSNLQWKFMHKYWEDELSESSEKVKEDVSRLFTDLKNRAREMIGEEAPGFYDELSENNQKLLVDNMLESGENPTALGEMKQTGAYLDFVSPWVMIDLLKKEPAKFFDGNVWDISYSSMPPEIPVEKISEIKDQTLKCYLNCLEDCARYSEAKRPKALLTQRARCSLDYLQPHLVSD
jgi:hypothetical protein